jgi:hypothetical protein
LPARNRLKSPKKTKPVTVSYSMRRRYEPIQYDARPYLVATMVILMILLLWTRGYMPTTSHDASGNSLSLSVTKFNGEHDDVTHKRQDTTATSATTSSGSTSSSLPSPSPKPSYWHLLPSDIQTSLSQNEAIEAAIKTPTRGEPRLSTERQDAKNAAAMHLSKRAYILRRTLEVLKAKLGLMNEPSEKVVSALEAALSALPSKNRLLLRPDPDDWNQQVFEQKAAYSLLIHVPELRTAYLHESGTGASFYLDLYREVQHLLKEQVQHQRKSAALPPGV